MPLINEVLKRNNLNKTLGRKKVLEFFLKSSHALVNAEIEKKLQTKIGRITIYRTLQSFLEKGIIHLIPSAGNSIKYALRKKDKKNEHTGANRISIKMLL